MFAAAWLVALAPPDTSATLWVVDDDGGTGVDFTEIQPAVDAAAEGDAILVRGGAYGSVTIDGKSLVVCGEEAAAVVLSDARIRVTNLAPGQSVLLQRLEVHGVLTAPFFGGVGLPAFEAANDAGAVRAEDCRFLPSDLLALLSQQPGGGGALVSGSSAVSLTRCELRGGLALSDSPYGGAPGLRALGSSVALYDCEVEGGFGPGGPCGAFGSCGAAAPAGDGAVLEGSLVFASGCAFLGGDGGAGESCLPVDPGGDGADGGDGVHLVSAGTTLRALACTLAAGAGGASAACAAGADGEALRSDGGTYVPLAGIGRSLEVKTPLPGGTPTLVQVDVGPGELVFGVASASPAYLPLDVFDGVLLCQPTGLVFALGTASAAGELAFAVPTAPPPPGAGAVVHYLQVAVLTASGAVKLGSNASLVLLE